MDIILDCLVQTAVYWPPVAEDGVGGHTVGPPVAVPCRWEEAVELIQDTSGRPYNSKAQVMVDRDVRPFGWLYLAGSEDADPDYAARLAAGLAATDPRTLSGQAWLIQQFNKDITLDGGEYVRTAYL